MVIRVTICGGGNGAHVLAGLAAMHPDVEPRVLTLYAGEAEAWADNMLQQEGFQVGTHVKVQNEVHQKLYMKMPRCQISRKLMGEKTRSTTLTFYVVTLTFKLDL